MYFLFVFTILNIVYFADNDKTELALYISYHKIQIMCPYVLMCPRTALFFFRLEENVWHLEY
jgi:hypothetical protein